MVWEKYVPRCSFVVIDGQHKLARILHDDLMENIILLAALLQQLVWTCYLHVNLARQLQLSSKRSANFSSTPSESVLRDLEHVDLARCKLR